MATKWDDRSKKLGDRGQEQKKFPSFYLWGFDGVPISLLLSWNLSKRLFSDKAYNGIVKSLCV